jgi:hypothetical protein
MIIKHLFKKLNLLLSIIILGGFILSITPCVSDHDDTHETSSVCICICINCDNLPLFQKVTISKIQDIIPISNVKFSREYDTFLHRDVIFSLLQPPKFS